MTLGLFLVAALANPVALAQNAGPAEALPSPVPTAEEPATDVPVAEVPAEGEQTGGELTEGEPAESEPTGKEVKPWNQGLTPEKRALAQPFFDKGNDFFRRSMFAKALAEYEQAVDYRDHPAIRFNMAVCLINLARPLDAFENLLQGLEYGAEPLAPGLFAQGQNYRTLLRAQLAEVRIVVKQGGANVTLDGELLFVGPGETTRLVLPIGHQLTATHPEMVTHNEAFEPKAGPAVHLIEINMLPKGSDLVMKRRWARWKPWAVIGGGLAAAAVGIPFYLSAKSSLNSHDRKVDMACPSTGCDPGTLPTDVSDLKTASQTKEVVAYSLFVAGGAIAAAGLVLTFYNRPQAKPPDDAPEGFAIAPLWSEGEHGIMSRFGISF
jgi:hypothetical protein